MLATDPVQPIKIFFCLIKCDIFFVFTNLLTINSLNA